jgi:hypothetical protein
MGDAVGDDALDESPARPLDELRSNLTTARDQDDPPAILEAQADVTTFYFERSFALVDAGSFAQVPENSRELEREAAELLDLTSAALEDDPSGLDDEARATYGDAREFGELARAVAQIHELGAVAASEMAAGDALMARVQFGTAADRYRLGNQSARAAVERIESLHASPPVEWSVDSREILGSESEGMRLLEGISSAMAELATANDLRFRSPVEAIGRYKEAATLFRELSAFAKDEDWLVMASYADVQATASEGLDELTRLSDPVAAASTFQQARVQLESIVDEDIPARLTAESASTEFLSTLQENFRRDLQGVTAMYHLARMRDQMARENWKLALTHADANTALLEETAASLPPEFKELAHLLRFEVGMVASTADVLRAEVFKDEHEWDQAISCYEDSRRHTDEAASSILKSGLPSAAAIQEGLMNSSAANLDLLIRSTEEARRQHEELTRLREELASLQGSLTDAFKNFGVHVNTKAEVVATVEQQRMSRSPWNFAGRSQCDGAGEENIGSLAGADDLDHHPLEVRAVVPMARLRSPACRHLMERRRPDEPDSFSCFQSPSASTVGRARLAHPSEFTLDVVEPIAEGVERAPAEVVDQAKVACPVRELLGSLGQWAESRVGIRDVVA